MSAGLAVRPIAAAEHLAFLRDQPSVSFLQTPAWGRVKTEWRRQSLGWYDGPRLVGVGLVLHRPVPGLDSRTLAYLPGGPVIDWTAELRPWLDPLAAHLRAEGAFAVRVGPPVRTHSWDAARVKQGLADPAITRLPDLPGARVDPVGARVGERLADAGWLPPAPEDGFGLGQPQHTHEIPLAGRAETDLLRDMNQLWRRNLRRAAQQGVEVGVGGPDDLPAFHELYVHTARRDRFAPRPLHYFDTLFAALRAEDAQRVRLYLAHHEGTLVAAAIKVRVHRHAWYLYGASSTAKREVRGANACQWAMLRDSLAEGCEVHDLRGITSTLDPTDPHAGLVRFKAGAGGQVVRYVGEWDLPLRPVLYRSFVLALRTRAHLRGRTR